MMDMTNTDVSSKVMENIVMNLNEHNDYLQRKLDHYNKWLMDPKREIGSGPYPGFPEDNAVKTGRAILQAEAKAKSAAKVAKAAKPKAEKAKRARKTEGPTKQERAVEIYKRLNGVKGDVIQMIQAELGMSLAGATTYFYNAKKLA